jgi:hypothetical protein
MKSHPQTDPYVTCPACQALNDRFATFCHECGTPIGTIATLDPISSIHTQGFLIRKAVDRPPKTIVLIGIWIMFLPVFLVSVCFAVFLVIYHYSFTEFFFFWGAVGLAYLSFVILYRVTKNYLAPRKDE